jgi:hypothetical protein
MRPVWLGVDQVGKTAVTRHHERVETVIR